MSLLVIEPSGLPTFDANDETFGRSEDAFLAVRGTPGTMPRVRMAQLQGSKVSWGSIDPPREPSPSFPDFVIFQLTGGPRPSVSLFYEVVAYSSRYARSTHYFRILTRGAGSLRTSAAFRFSNQWTVNRAIVDAANGRNASDQLTMLPVIREHLQVLQAKGYPKGGKTPPKSRFERILALDPVAAEWEDKLVAWKETQDNIPTADFLELEMNALEEEKAAENRGAAIAKTRAENKAKALSLSEAEINSIIEELDL